MAEEKYFNRSSLGLTPTEDGIILLIVCTHELGIIELFRRIKEVSGKIELAESTGNQEGLTFKFIVPLKDKDVIIQQLEAISAIIEIKALPTYEIANKA